MTVTIFHNPACGTSRNTLAMIRAAGIEPQVAPYRETPPDRARLEGLIAAIGRPVREIMHRKGAPYHALGLDDPAVDDAALIDAMLAHPILIERPFVETPHGARLRRPPETAPDLLGNPDIGAFAKEDGEVVRK